MDNILYEIRDRKGIPKEKLYEPWKRDLLSDLNFSGFIEQKDSLYVLTEAGREVIKDVSFKVYNQKIESGSKRTKAKDILKNGKKEIVKFWFVLLVFAQLFVFMILALYSF